MKCQAPRFFKAPCRDINSFIKHNGQNQWWVILIDKFKTFVSTRFIIYAMLLEEIVTLVVCEWCIIFTQNDAYQIAISINNNMTKKILDTDASTRSILRVWWKCWSMNEMYQIFKILYTFNFLKFVMRWHNVDVWFLRNILQIEQIKEALHQ